MTCHRLRRSGPETVTMPLWETVEEHKAQTQGFLSYCVTGGTNNHSTLGNSEHTSVAMEMPCCEQRIGDMVSFFGVFLSFFVAFSPL